MAVDFLGTDEYLDCGSGATLDDIAEITVVTWLNVDTLSGAIYPVIASKVLHTSTRGWLFQYEGDGGANNTKCLIWWQYFNGTGDGMWQTATNSFATAGAWRHVAVTYNRGATTNDPIMYIGGAAPAISEILTPNGAADSETADSLFVGKYSGGNFTDGKMEDFRVFNRILGADEVAILAAGYRGPMGGEVLWLPMDGARATAVFDGATLVAGTNYLNDITGNGNHGNPSGSPLGYASDCPRSGPTQPLVAHMGPQTTAYRMRHWRRQRDMYGSVSEQIT